MTEDKPDDLPEETDSLFDSLRRMGKPAVPDKLAPDKLATDKLLTGKRGDKPDHHLIRPRRALREPGEQDAVDPPAGLDRPKLDTNKAPAKSSDEQSAEPDKKLSRRKVERSGGERRHASQVVPPGETAHRRRSRLIRELEAGREGEFDTDQPSNPLTNIIRAEPTLPVDGTAEAEPEKPAKEAKKKKEADSLRDLAETRTPIEEYRRRRKLLTHDLELTAGGLDSRYVKYDRKNLAKVFAEMLAARQFDTFANDRVWRAARMESRITFLNTVMIIHSKIYGYQPAKLDDRFYEDITNYPSSASNPTGITSYDRERAVIQLYPSFWNNEVSFPDMISEVFEQNTRNHVRQMVQMYSVGQIKHDDPRYAQAALFNVQIDTYDELVNAQTTEDVKAGKRVTTAMFMPPNEMGFDIYAKSCAEKILERLFEVIDDPSDGSGGSARR
ncbi:MAG: hypothetical protein AAF556_02715 [Pseudomonadota bacterium]